nr:hypothetical protein [Tanacetum cinerariifolium]
MRRIGKGFLGVETPLFDAMLVQQQIHDDAEMQEDEDDEVSAAPTPPLPTPATTPPPPQQEPIPLPPQAQSAQPSSPPQQQPSQTAGISESSMTLLNKLMETCDILTKKDTDEAELAEVEELLKVVTVAKLMTEVVTTVAPITTAAQVPKASASRRRRGVIIQDPEETAASVIFHIEVKPKDKGKGILIKEPKPLKGQAQIDMNEAFARQLEAKLNENINWNDVIEQVKKREKHDNTVIRYQALKRKPVTKAQARHNIMIYLKNMAGFKMDFFKGMTYTYIRPIFEKHYNYIQAFLEKEKKEIEEEESKRKATPLASKVLVVDYQIHHKNNKPYYKIIRADGTHKEDLETLWTLVKEIFESIEPKNFSDDFLLNTLKIMFEKPNVEANV